MFSILIFFLFYILYIYFILLYFIIFFKKSIALKQGWISSIITTVFNVTWSLEIILICWFAAQEIFLIIINLENSGILLYSRSQFTITFNSLDVTHPSHQLKHVLFYRSISVHLHPQSWRNIDHCDLIWGHKRQWCSPYLLISQLYSL